MSTLTLTAPASLSASHIGVFIGPLVVTDGAPGLGLADFHSALGENSASYDPDAATCTPGEGGREGGSEGGREGGFKYEHCGLISTSS